MGLNASHKEWKRQTKYFGHEHSSEYTSLVFDNRGVGQSDKPTCLYSTSEMALDAIDLLTALGWINPKNAQERTIHLIGASMGGMIAQEVAMRIPGHLRSMTLSCTAPRLIRQGPFLENLRERAGMFIPRHIDEELGRLAYTLFGDGFLDQPDNENEDPRLNFPTKRDRFAAGQLQKRADTEAFTKKGFMLQVYACWWHHKSPAQLRKLGDTVGRERIMLLHGTADRMLTVIHGETLRKELGEGVTWKQYDGVGHMLGWEVEREMNEDVARFVDKCEKLQQ